jgi:hypothetical protein
VMGKPVAQLSELLRRIREQTRKRRRWLTRRPKVQLYRAFQRYGRAGGIERLIGTRAKKIGGRNDDQGFGAGAE